VLADSDVDAVVIACPFDMNHRITTEAIAAGKHVMLEKPMAATIEEAYELVELENSSSLVTLVAENFRYLDQFVEAKRWIDEGKIGKSASVVSTMYDHYPRNVKWLTDSKWRLSCYGGVCLYRDVHFLAVQRDLFGEVKGAIGHHAKLRDDIGPVDYLSLSKMYPCASYWRAVSNNATVFAAGTSGLM
jgi:predicted dehydrogenase